MDATDNHTPNSFQCPNIYVDELEFLLTSDEFKVLVFICRRILGFQQSRKIKRNKISLSQICGKILSRKEDGKVLSYGVGLSRATVIKCLIQLEKFKLIFRIGESDKKGQEYELNIGQIEPIDFNGLRERKSVKYSVGLKRTSSARNKIASIDSTQVSPTDHIVENNRLVPLTTPVSPTNHKTAIFGKSDQPLLVSGTDTLNTQERNKKETNKRNTRSAPKGGASKYPPPDKIALADFVYMTEAENQKLIERFGEEFSKRCIEFLDNYKGASPKKRKYESDYRAILNWVVSAVQDEIAKENFRNGQTQRNTGNGRNFGGDTNGDASKGRLFQPGEQGQYGGASGKRSLRELLDKNSENAARVQ